MIQLLASLDRLASICCSRVFWSKLCKSLMAAVGGEYTDLVARVFGFSKSGRTGVERPELLNHALQCALTM